jgi:hypothetical protein
VEAEMNFSIRDVATEDFRKENLIRDGAKHTLDLSAILPPEAAGLPLCLGVYTDTTDDGDQLFVFDGETTNLPEQIIMTDKRVGGPYYQIIWLACSANRKISYTALGPFFGDQIDIMVRGYFYK